MRNRQIKQNQSDSFALPRAGYGHASLAVLCSLLFPAAITRPAVAASFVNVAPASSGSVGFSVLVSPNQTSANFGPSGLSAINSNVQLSCPYSVSASASNTFSVTDSSITAQVSCDTWWPGAFSGDSENYSNITSYDSAQLTISFEVSQTGMFSFTNELGSAGTSYELAHENASVTLSGLIDGSPVSIEPYYPAPTQLLANVPYTLTVAASSNVSNFNDLAVPTGDFANFTITAIPEPTLLPIVSAALLAFSLPWRKRGSR